MTRPQYRAVGGFLTHWQNASTLDKLLNVAGGAALVVASGSIYYDYCGNCLGGERLSG